jgi:hypothetical protein
MLVEMITGIPVVALSRIEKTDLPAPEDPMTSIFCTGGNYVRERSQVLDLLHELPPASAGVGNKKNSALAESENSSAKARGNS